MSQAPGLSGTPDSGHRSSAATSASCASSSARPTSRTIRARPAMSLADSILQTASIARCVSDVVTSGRRGATRLLLRGHLRANSLLLLPELGRELAAKVLRLEHLANLDLRLLAEGGALDPFDRLFLRLHLPEPEARDQLLRLGEGPVDYGPLPSRELDARALRARVKPFGGEQHAGFRQLFVVLPPLGKELLAGQNARLRVLVGFNQDHESHRRVSFCLRVT